MELTQAKKIVQELADGIDPTTGEIFDDNSVFNKPEVIRALFTLLHAVPDEVDPLRNAGKPWNTIEDNKLRDEFALGVKIGDIAKEHGRTRGAIESRLDLLGLQKKPFWFLKRKR